jgi:hypothetical protein
LEVLFPEKTVHFGSTVPRKNSAFWKYCSQKKQRILEVLFPEKNSAFWKYCSRKKQRILEVLFPEKMSALIAGERSTLTLAQFYLFLFFRVQYFHFFIFP